EDDMLDLMLAALRRHGAPGTLYLDNGATYRGDVLRLACERLGVTLIHAQPYDAPARGKMERFWRTLREGCLDHLGTMTSLHDVQVRLLAFLDEHYHRAPHGGLFGRTPAQACASASAPPRPRRTSKRPRPRPPPAPAAAPARTARSISTAPRGSSTRAPSPARSSPSPSTSPAPPRRWSSTTAAATCSAPSMRSPPARP